MKQKTIYLVIIGLFILTSSCQKKTSSKPNLIHSHSFEVSGVSTIKLDSLTGFFTPFIQTFQDQGEFRVAILNHLINRIQVYDGRSGAQITNIDFDLVGPNGIGERPKGFHFINMDSILVFDEWAGKVSLIDNKGIKLDSYDLAPNGINTGFAIPQVTSEKPITFINQKLYLSGLLLPWEGLELNENQFLEFNLKNKSLSYKFKRPNLYNEHNWGNRLMFFMNYDYNPNLGEFIFGFNNYDKLIFSDSTLDKRLEVNTPSKYFESISPYDNEFNYNWDKSHLKEYNYQTPRFWTVMYDVYRDLIYRLVLHPYSKDDYRSGIRRMKVSILIVSKENGVIGEYDLDLDEYDSRMMFISNQGLHIANKRKFQNNEDILSFDIFKVIEK